MSGGSQQAPTPFQPPNQRQVAQDFQTGTNQLATAGSNLYGQVAPQLAGISSAVAGNPYYGQAQTGAQNAANLALTSVAPSQFAGAGQDAQIANIAALAGPQYASAATQGGVTGYNQAQSLLPQATQGASAAPGVFNQAQSLIPSTTYPELLAGLSVLNTGFDPQSALYNRQFQQQQDQANAVNAQSGVAGSPYAAGIVNTNDRNFNIDWQNAQLARQIQALGAYDSAASTAAGNLVNLQTAGTTNFNALNTGAIQNATNLINTGTGALNSGISTGAGALSTLGSTAYTGNTAASDLGTAGLNTIAGASQLPSDIFLQQKQAELGALGAQVQGTNASLEPTQQAIADRGSYLQIGQQASQGAIQAAQVNNQASAASSAGFGNLFGSIAGMFSFAAPLGL